MVRMKIPRTFHQVWTSIDGKSDPGEFPSAYYYYQRTWLRNHPEWNLHVWKDEDIFPLINQKQYDEATSFAARSDILRLEIIYKHGGVYIDTDFESYKNIEPLIKDTDCFVGCEAEGVMTNALFGATPGHPTIKKLIDALPKHSERYKKYPANITTGPAFWTKTLDYDEIKMFPPIYFYPIRPGVESPRNLSKLYPDSYANHHWSGSWTSEETQLMWGKFQRSWKKILERKKKATLRPIPRIFHTIWIGDNPFPEEFQQYRQTWLKHHPNWSMLFWDDDNMPVDTFFNKDLYKKTDGLSRKADIAQYELLYKYGGVYIDADFECFKNIEPLMKNYDAWGCGENDLVISTGIMGFKKGHPLLKKIMGNFEYHMEKYSHEPANVTTGPIFLTETIGLNGIKKIPTHYLYPYGYNEQHKKGQEFPEAYAAHHWAASWIKG